VLYDFLILGCHAQRLKRHAHFLKHTTANLRLEQVVVGTAALLFEAQRKGLIGDAEVLIVELNRVGYRISSAVVAQLKQSF